MKKKDKENLQAKTVDELRTAIASLETEILKLQMDQKSGAKVKNINEARSKMKDKARMLTLITEKGKKV